jgi:3D (Asp-Asp-Asp) domain-containing protein
MKTLHLIAFGFLVIANTAGAEQRVVLARVTSYWKSEGSGTRASWNGARLHSGHCAVDPKKIPYGSKVIFPDTTCIAVDSGPDVVSRKAARYSGRTVAQRSALVIDRFFETRADAQRWMAANGSFMTVQIETPDNHARQGTSPSDWRTRSTSKSFQLSLGLDAPVHDHVAIASKPLPQPSARAVKRRA